MTMTGTDNSNMGAYYYTGVDQTTPLANITSGGDAASPMSVTNTSDRDGSWHAGVLYGNLITSLTGGVKRENLQNADNIGDLVDGNQQVASGSTGTFDLVWSNLSDGGYTTFMIRSSAGATAKHFSPFPSHYNEPNF
jgi:hypothetical protein